MLGNKEDNPFRLDGYDGVAGELQFRKYLGPMRPPRIEGNVHSPGVYLAGYVQSGFCSGRFRKEYDYIDYYGMPARAVSYDFREDIASWGFGFTMGYQRTLWHVLFLEAFIDGAIRFSDTDQSGQGSRHLRKRPMIRDPIYKGILPRLGLNIGIGI